MNTFHRRLLGLSRPHFWLYELGTFFIGVVIAASASSVLLSPWVLLYALYFLFPANLLIYGINDIYDYETDRLNPKKAGYEAVLPKSLHPKVLKAILYTNAPFILLAVWLPQPATIALLVFVLCATFYSASPIRAKARPGYDSVFSAGHYVATGVFGYYVAGGTTGAIWLPVVAGMAWAMAMHAYSAVPDIKADASAKLATIATLLGKKVTIWLCLVFYTVAAWIASQYLGGMAIVLYIPYLLMMILSLYSNEAQLFKLYTYFPWINGIVGMVIFFTILLQKSWL